MKKILLLLCSAFIAAGCGIVTTGQPSSGGERPTKIEFSTGGREYSTIAYTVGAVYPSEMHFAVPGKPVVKTFAPYLFFASYVLDAANVRSMREPLVTSSQVRVEIQLTGEDGTISDSSFKVGTYSPKAENVNGIRMLKLSSFVNGKHTETSFDVMTPGAKAAGYVKITSVTEDVVRGSIDLTEGEMYIKGTFVAQLPQAKQ